MDTKDLAYKIRVHCVEMTNRAKSSHVGAMLSIADIVAVLFSKILKIDPSNPRWENRDRFILSKGHAGGAIYAALSERGFFSKDLLETYYANGSLLSGHLSHKGVPGVEISTGSLGHGLSVAAGMAYSAYHDSKNHRIYALLSDGECDEGSTWEAVMFSAHHKLSNLICIIDYNKIQSMAPVKDVIELEPFADKWKAFGWEVVEVDGHDHNKLIQILDVKPFSQSKPTVIIAHTIKGKGVSFMENTVLWHYRSPQDQEYLSALKELENNYHA